MALGKTTKEIAAERFLSVYTVMTHRKNIFRKLEVLVYSIYTEALLNLRIGYSAAIGVILLIIVSILTVIYFWGFSRKVHYQ